MLNWPCSSTLPRIANGVTGPPTYSRNSDSAIDSTTALPTSPAASNSGLPWPAPSSRTPTCCWQENTIQIAELLADLNRKGLSIIMVTHDMALAENSAHRVVRMDYGRLVDNSVTPDEGGDR